MKNKQNKIFTVRVTCKADITLTVEADGPDEALRLASAKAQTADNSEYNIYDEEDVTIIGVWTPEHHSGEFPNLPDPIHMALGGGGEGDGPIPETPAPG